MRLFLLTALAMVPLAANSVLNRLAIADGGIDPVSFGTIRLISGALALTALCVVLNGGVRPNWRERTVGVLSLLLYMYGFSTAYLSLDAGLGALILFGFVQVTMFAGAVLGKEDLSTRRWVGAIMAFGGLVWLFWPGGSGAVSLLHGGLMALAGLGWGIYSLAGRNSRDPIQATAANFLLAACLGIPLTFLLPTGGTGLQLAPYGVFLAVLSGAVTSGMAYAFWYSLLPQIRATTAAVAQLTVPLIAMVGGMAFLQEELTLRFAVASIVILGGVALSVVQPGRRQQG